MAINRNDWINEVKQDAYGATGNPAQLSTASGSAPSYSARAWVNFNGSGVVAIRSSGNVSSVTDNGTGNYIINFTNSMTDANYAITATGRGVNGGDSLVGILGTPAVSSVNIETGHMRNVVTAQDLVFVNVAIFK